MNGVLRAQAQRRAASGADYLTHVATAHHLGIVPAYWHRNINLDILDVGNARHCVLAQIGQTSPAPYNLLHYKVVAEALGLDPFPGRSGDVVELGFRAEPGPWGYEEYRELTIAWKWLILQRRAADPAFARVSLAS